MICDQFEQRQENASKPLVTTQRVMSSLHRISPETYASHGKVVDDICHRFAAKYVTTFGYDPETGQNHEDVVQIPAVTIEQEVVCRFGKANPAPLEYLLQAIRDAATPLPQQVVEPTVSIHPDDTIRELAHSISEIAVAYQNNLRSTTAA